MTPDDLQIQRALKYLWSKERIGLIGRPLYKNRVITINDVTPVIWNSVIFPELKKLVNIISSGRHSEESYAQVFLGEPK